MKKHWSVSGHTFTDKRAEAIWRLEERINHGVGGRIKESELREYWDEIEIDPAKRRALELALGL